MILFNDTGIDTNKKRSAWLQDTFGVRFTDELNVYQASEAIEILRETKEKINK